MALAPLLLLLSFLLTTITFLRLRRTGSRPGPSPILPRGCLGWPIIGETLEFVSAAYSSRPESFMNRRRLLYGKVFKSHLFGSPTIVSTDAEVSRFVLQSDARAFVPSYPKSLSELMGKSSILLINGALQRRVHGLIGGFFKSPQLKSQITADMQSYVRRAMDSWPETRPILIQDETKHIVFQILVKGLIGLEPGDEMLFLKREFHEFITGLMSLPVNLPGTRLYRSLKAKKKMVMLMKKVIEEKRRKKSLGLVGPTPKDVIDVLINDTSGQLTDELISDNMIDLMIPAEDSVPVLITLAVKYLSSCPVALRQLEVKDMSSCSFTPFGGGLRLCPGLDLARLEASIFLHHLVTSFTWVADEDQVVNFPTVRMKSGMPVRVTRKKVAFDRDSPARVVT